MKEFLLNTVALVILLGVMPSAGFCFSPAPTRPTPEDTCARFRGNTDPASSLNIVFVSYGYRGDNATFNENAKLLANNLMIKNPFRGAKINFYTLYRPSDSGVFCFSLDRLWTCGGSENNIRAITKNTCGLENSQQVVISGEPSGTGKGSSDFQSVTTVAFHRGGAEDIFVHEFGHSFGKLSDEYVDPKLEAINGKIQLNCRRGASAASGCAGWKDLIDAKVPGVGCYQGCVAGFGAWRSSQYSMMRDAYGDFNPVSQRYLCCELSRITKQTPPACTIFNQVGKGLKNVCGL